MTIEDDVALLERVPTFRMLSREALRVLAIGAESQTLHGGEVLFREGEPADCGFVVEEGVLAAVVPGNPEPALLRRGVLLGEMSLLAQTRRPATVTATEPSSVMRIPRALFLRMLQGYPDVAERLRSVMAERTEQLTRELAGVRYAFDRGDPPVELSPSGEPGD
jgi:CRP-like cAMP-binding protein